MNTLVSSDSEPPYYGPETPDISELPGIPEGSTLVVMGPYTYSSLAARKYAETHPGITIVEVSTMQEVWEAGRKGAYILVPFENSSSGVVEAHLDTMVREEMAIAAEIQHRVHMCALGVSGASLKKANRAVSHIQGIKQCSGFLAQHPHIVPETVASTGVALKEVANLQDSNVIALGSAEDGKRLGLVPLEEGKNLSNNPYNVTQMFLLHRNGQEPLPHVTYPFHAARVTLQNRPGSFRDMLSTLHDGNIDLLSLHDIPSADGETHDFFLEMRNQGDEESFRQMLQVFNAQVLITQWYGSWSERVEPEGDPSEKVVTYPASSLEGLDLQKKFHAFEVTPENKPGVLFHIVEALSGSGKTGNVSRGNLVSADSRTIAHKTYTFALGLESENHDLVQQAIDELEALEGVVSLSCHSFDSREELQAFLKPEKK